MKIFLTIKGHPKLYILTRTKRMITNLEFLNWFVLIYHLIMFDFT